MARIDIRTDNYELVELASSEMMQVLDFAYEDRIDGRLRRVTGKVIGVSRPTVASDEGKPFVIHVEGEEVLLPD